MKLLDKILGLFGSSCRKPVIEKPITKAVQPYIFRNVKDKALWIDLLKFHQTKSGTWTLKDPGCQPRTIDAVGMADHILHNIEFRERK